MLRPPRCAIAHGACNRNRQPQQLYDDRLYLDGGKRSFDAFLVDNCPKGVNLVNKSLLLNASKTILCLLILLQPLVPTCQAEGASSIGSETIKSPTTAVIPLSQLKSRERRLFDLIKTGNYQAAQQVLRAELRGASPEDSPELLSLLSYVDLQLNRVSAAITDLRRIDPATSQTIRQRIVTLKRTADLYLQVRKESQAKSAYKEALSLCGKLDRTDPVIVEILEPLIGCVLRDEGYRAAQPYADQLVDVCRDRAKSGELSDVASLFYAYCELLQIYSQTDMNQHKQVLAEMMPFLDRLLKLRAQNEGDTPETEAAAFQKMQDALLLSYITINKPQRLSEFLWLSRQFRARSLPLIDWQPNEQKPKAVLLCVPALGLENRAFMPFAKEMAGRGFAVYAMDVRGFGAWQSEYGSETVDFKHALADIQALIQIVKTRHKNLAVFLVGESMGGALALRAASEFGSDMDGVISSVPSAERHGGGKMAAQVAIHFLRSPHKPFDIVSDIATQATSQNELIEIWKKDPKAKIGLSPIELIEFDRFMKITESRCSLIRSTSVMLIQGLADKLVKPSGTYTMFDKINSADKALIIIGKAEHLILETTNQSKLLLQGLSAWLENHIDDARKTVPGT